MTIQANDRLYSFYFGGYEPAKCVIFQVRVQMIDKRNGNLYIVDNVMGSNRISLDQVDDIETGRYFTTIDQLKQKLHYNAISQAIQEKKRWYERSPRSN